MTLERQQQQQQPPHQHQQQLQQQPQQQQQQHTNSSSSRDLTSSNINHRNSIPNNSNNNNTSSSNNNNSIKSGHNNSNTNTRNISSSTSSNNNSNNSNNNNNDNKNNNSNNSNSNRKPLASVAWQSSEVEAVNNSELRRRVARGLCDAFGRRTAEAEEEEEDTFRLFLETLLAELPLADAMRLATDAAKEDLAESWSKAALSLAHQRCPDVYKVVLQRRKVEAQQLAAAAASEV
ncbi:unnamed protein product [Polarella glacialis]|uniref:Uncharacterized protein n=1 Tax=Polarella glacialis TaxID=89957 RepID=A0A813DH05_POLGL|nr:unnamed protein product [Polarella glacialis]